MGRPAALVVGAVLGAIVLAGCGDDASLDDGLPTELPDVPTELPDVPTELPDVPTELPDVPTELPDVPTELPSIPLPDVDLPGGDDGGGEDGDGDGEPGDAPPPEADPEETADSPEGEAAAPPPPTDTPDTTTPGTTPSETTAPTTAEEATDVPAADTAGTPAWVWVLLAILAVALTLALVAAFRRGGPELSAPELARLVAERTQAARADGQLAWVRSAVDDSLLQWRAQQLSDVTTQRDPDSDPARRWDAVDRRLGGAVDDLLALESAAATDETRAAASTARHAAEAYRAAVDAMVSAYRTGDPTVVSMGSTDLAARAADLDYAGRRLQEALQLRGQQPGHRPSP